MLEGVVPSINFEDSTATRLSASIQAKKQSEVIGLEFVKNSNPITLIELKNYGIIYNLSIIGRIGEGRKLLGLGDTFSAQIVDLGNGALIGLDYISISVDYIYQLDGFKPDEDLLVKFE
ncbi:MAG: hypothetical protein AB4080_07445 [Trichodesmium sp.]